MVTEAGGVPSATCNSFLCELEEFDEEVDVQIGQNSQQAKALLIPINGVMDSNLILQCIEVKCNMCFSNYFLFSASPQ